ncbi:MAG: hypothetical protein AAGH89_01595 [Verrucomicrobiota bacterium]
MKLKTKWVFMAGCFSIALWITGCKEIAEIQSMEVETTGYSHTQESQKKWGLVTASGAPLQSTKAHNSAAADWSRFPVGTVFRLSNYPERFVVEDYGPALVGKDVIDIYRSDRESANNWGRQMLTIEILEWGSFERSREILATRLQVPYCKTMHDAIVAKLEE